MDYDYSKLRGKITELYGKSEAFAEAVGVSERTLSLKLNNKRSWKQPEIEKACGLLEIPCTEIPAYFFTH